MKTNDEELGQVNGGINFLDENESEVPDAPQKPPVLPPKTLQPKCYESMPDYGSDDPVKVCPICGNAYRGSHRCCQNALN